MHKTVPAQVADLLVEESGRRIVVNPVTVDDRQPAGVSRQSVNEALGRLREPGLVETGYRSVRILDVPGVTAISAG